WPSAHLPPRLDQCAACGNKRRDALVTDPPRFICSGGAGQAERVEHSTLHPGSCDPRLGAEELRLRTVQHSLGLDAADALRRRLSRGGEVALRILALQLAVRLSGVRRPCFRASA